MKMFDIIKIISNFDVKTSTIRDIILITICLVAIGSNSYKIKMLLFGILAFIYLLFVILCVFRDYYGIKTTQFTTILHFMMLVMMLLFLYYSFCCYLREKSILKELLYGKKIPSGLTYYVQGDFNGFAFVNEKGEEIMTGTFFEIVKGFNDFNGIVVLLQNKKEGELMLASFEEMLAIIDDGKEDNKIDDLYNMLTEKKHQTKSIKYMIEKIENFNKKYRKNVIG